MSRPLAVTEYEIPSYITSFKRLLRLVDNRRRIDVMLRMQYRLSHFTALEETALIAYSATHDAPPPSIAHSVLLFVQFSTFLYVCQLKV